mmetsp:Transcript_74798/g.207998  ORF Transcript_74798/g.207998 Transcript_74798/m.207998 type:complete len:86 (-) Transcript_74798:87-344(-)
MNDKFLAKDTQVIGASADSAAANKAWSNKFSFPFPLICDGKRALCSLFGGKKRWAVLVDKERKVKAFWPEVVDKKGFAAEALAAL